MRKKIITRKGEKTLNERIDSHGFIPLKTKVLKIKANFSFHSLIERIWNDYHGSKDDYKPLNYFLEKAINSSYSIPAPEFRYIIEGVVTEWFEDESLLEEIEEMNYEDGIFCFLYLCKLVLGGGTTAKKFLARQLAWKVRTTKNL